MRDYDSQKWFDLYRTAILELQRAAITGRIRDARSEITTRLETLRQHPDLHHTELSAIQDPLNNLRVFGARGGRMAAEDKKRILQQTVQKLTSIAPRFLSSLAITARNGVAEYGRIDWVDVHKRVEQFESDAAASQGEERPVREFQRIMGGTSARDRTGIQGGPKNSKTSVVKLIFFKSVTRDSVGTADTPNRSVVRVH